jgi:hypothetical protein
MSENNLPEVVTREQWLAARKELLTSEKEAVRAKDALNTRRRRLPMVRIDKDYRFTGPDGPRSLLDLFGQARQLIVQHFMFHPDWEDGCGSCTAAVDELSDGLLRHLHARDTEYAVIARAPLANWRSTGPNEAGGSRCTPPTARTSTTTSTSPSTRPSHRSSSTTATRTNCAPPEWTGCSTPRTSRWNNPA